MAIKYSLTATLAWDTHVNGCCDLSKCEPCLVAPCSNTDSATITTIGTHFTAGVTNIAVNPCFGDCPNSCNGYVDGGAGITYTVTNSSPYCVHVQYWANFDGGGNGGAVTALFNGCDNPFTYAQGFGAYWFACLSPGASFSPCIKWTITGQTNPDDCLQGGLSGIYYDVYCAPDFPCAFSGFSCPSCP